MAGEPLVTICGNLTADPEIRFMQSGQAVANFTVASTPRNQNKQTQQWEDGEAMFVRCSVWGEYAENVSESLVKGTRVLVTGKLTVRSYEAKNGERRQSIELAVDEVGPSLRYAKAQVQRTGQNQGGAYQGQQSGRAASGRPTYSAAQGGTQGDPWAQTPYPDAPPF